MKFDIIIRGGRILDPFNNIDKAADIAVITAELPV